MWQYNYTPELKHYASKYYDPVEAHEYYEKHKQLKGRQAAKATTATLNEEGKSAAAYVKEKIDAEKEEALLQEQLYKEAYQEKLREVTQRTMEQHNSIMNQRIDSLRKMIKRMTPTDRKRNAPMINSIIKRLRDENKAKREAVEAQYKSDNVVISQQSASDRKAIQKYYAEEYQNELEGMNKESNWKKPEK